jgi:transcriptional regulator with XRE-family HTH domain
MKTELRKHGIGGCECLLAWLVGLFKQERVRRKLSVGRLAKRAGVPVEVVHRFEACQAGGVRLSDLLAVAKALGIRLTVQALPKEPGPSQLLNLSEMRAWRGKQVIVRTAVLLVCLNQVLSPEGFRTWLKRRDPELDGNSPLEILNRGKWRILADLIDDMLTGVPL